MPASVACPAYTPCYHAPHLCPFIKLVSAFRLDRRYTSNTMLVLLNFIEYGYIVGRTCSIAYSRKLFACFCCRQLINAAPSILIVSASGSTQRIVTAFKNGSEVRVWSLLTSPDVNGSYDRRTLSINSLSSGTCMRGTIWRVDSHPLSPLALKSQQKLMSFSS